MKKLKVNAIINTIILLILVIANSIFTVMAYGKETETILHFVGIAILCISLVVSVISYFGSIKETYKYRLYNKLLGLSSVGGIIFFIILVSTTGYMHGEGHSEDFLIITSIAHAALGWIPNVSFSSKLKKHVYNNIDELINKMDSIEREKNEKLYQEKLETEKKKYLLECARKNEAANLEYRQNNRKFNNDEFIYGNKEATSSFKLVKTSFNEAFKYGVSSFASYMKLSYLLVINLVSMIIPFIYPFTMVATYKVYEDLSNECDAKILDSFNGINSFAKYIRLYFVGIILFVMTLAGIITSVLVASPIIMLAFSVRVIAMILIFALGLFLTVALTIFTFSMLPVNIIYAKSELTAFAIIRKSFEVANGRKMKMFLSILFAYLFILILFIPIIIFVVLSISLEALWLLILPIIGLLFILPIIAYAIKLIEFKIIYQKVK